MPITNENIEPVQKFRSRKQLRSTIGCGALKARQKKTRALTPETISANVTGPFSSQSFEGPSSSAYSIAPRNPAIEIRPVQSKRGSSV